MDIDKCLHELNIEEKLLLLEGADMGFTNPIPRLGIPRVLLADGPHGARVNKTAKEDNGEPYAMDGEFHASTALPCEAGMAATWNLELLEQTGKQIGEECQEFGAGVLLGPGADGKRSPLGGRNFEYYSEDPYLSGKMAAAFIRGIQSEGVGACMKHYVLNDQETRRSTVDVHVDERTLWEIYLKPFEIAIREAQPWMIMGSYNKTKGEQICESREMLTDILRDRLGFQGAVVSDWSAVKDKVKSLCGGLDLQMPGPSRQIPMLLEAVQRGELLEEDIDILVRHVLELVEKVTKGKKTVTIDWEKHHRTAVRLAEEGTVLLKNADNILPLRKGCKIAVIGELAKKPFFIGGGSSSLTPRQLDLPLSCIRELAEVSYAEGYHGDSTDEELSIQAVSAARDAEVVILFTGFNTTEGLDRSDILLPRAHIQLAKKVAEVNRNVILVTQCGSAVEYRQIEADVKAILHSWIPGEGCGRAIANLLFGLVCPSGKLTETFPVALANTPAYQHFPGYKDDVFYREGLLTGYRYYDTQEIAPQYPFGYGLSYTEFAYANLCLSSRELKNGEKLKITFEVKNVGGCIGQEIVQVYVADQEAHMFRPRKELKGFAKVELAPGETKTVEIELDEEAFAYYVPHLGRFAVESGIFGILVGSSSADIRLGAEVEFHSADEVRMPLTVNDCFKDYLEDDRYADYASGILEMLHVDKSHMFYELICGAGLKQLPGLFCFFGIDADGSDEIISSLTERRLANLSD